MGIENPENTELSPEEVFDKTRKQLSDLEKEIRRAESEVNKNSPKSS